MNNDANDFDLFATPEEDTLKEELAKGTYRWSNKATLVLAGLFILVSATSAGAWYGHRSSTTSGASSFANLRSQFAGLSGRNTATGTTDAVTSGTLTAGTTAPSLSGAAPGGFGGGGFGRGTSGTITKISGTTIHIQKSDGTTVTVNAAADTPVVKSSVGSLSSLKVGETISVTGQAGTDGSISPFAITEGSGLGVNRGGTSGGGGSAGRANNSSPTTQATTSSGVQTQQQTTPKVSSSGRAKNPTGVKPTTSAKPVTSPRPAISGGSRAGGGGGGRFSDPAFTDCLAKAGVSFTAGSRPDFQDPKVAQAMESCRSLLPNGGAGGGGFGNRPGATPTPAAS